MGLSTPARLKIIAETLDFTAFFQASCFLPRSRFPISPYHVTLSLNVISQHFDILAEPPYGPKSGVTSGSKLGFVKASGHRKSLVTTAFL